MISLPGWLIVCLEVNAVLGVLVYYRIYTKTKIMRTKDEARDQMYHSVARRDAQHWSMTWILFACVTFLIPRVVILILSIMLEYVCTR